MLDAPLGERVFAIAVSPLDGDVWIASSHGLARYRVHSKSWRSYNRETGLPSEQVQALAFDKKGTLYAAAQCDGLAIGQAGDDYARWHSVTQGGALSTAPGQQATGYGLPSNQLNDVLVAPNGTVYVATLNGLAQSLDHGVTWTYERGQDYVAKIQQRSSSNSDHPTTDSPAPSQPIEYSMAGTLAEDDVTHLAQDSAGHLWLGHRWQVPYEVRDEANGSPLYNGGVDGWRGNTSPINVPSMDIKDLSVNDYVTSFLMLKNGQVAVGRYGGGLTMTSWRASKSGHADELYETAEQPFSSWTEHAPFAVWPQPAPPPTLSDLQAALAALPALPPSSSPQSAVYLGEDWTTQGDWVGRYGSRYAMLCAMQAPMDHEVVADTRYRVQGELGPYATPGDGLRHWVHWERVEWNANVLYDPILGYPREAEWDDHSETVSRTSDLGDVWARVTVPAGTHQITAYFYNKDGEYGANRFRDFLLQLRPGAATTLAASKLSPLAWTRVRDFKGGGVYKSFLVRGGGDYWLQVGRNYSFNTVLQAVFVDEVAGAADFHDHLDSPYLHREYATPPQFDEAALKLTDQSDKSQTLKQQTVKEQAMKAAVALWDELDRRQGDLSTAPGQWSKRMLCYRAAREAGAPPELLTAWRWKLVLWTLVDRSDFGKRMQSAFVTLLKENPDLKNVKR